ncbi:MAG: amidohydrolase family protein [Dehalococcoidia bacterium]|nr:amidohydrolase family protein [Dehalococcoidia bacterium]
MPFGGNDWLALTEEPTLEPEIPICDPHHHLWDRRPARIPYQNYLLSELYDDLNSGHNVVSTVFVETNAMYRTDGPEEMRPVGEVEFVQGLAAAASTDLYGPAKAAASIVGHANLHLGDAVEPVLEALQRASPQRFRGIRHGLTYDDDPDIGSNRWNRKEQLGEEGFRAGARVLARMGFSFDAWMYFHQLPELVAFAQAIPELPIILNHIGGVLGTGPYANLEKDVIPVWKKNLAEVAKCPNVTVKLGGIGQPRTGYDWSAREKPIGSEELAGLMAPFMNYAIEQFGPDRGMIESNFPPDKVGHSYNILYNAFKRLTKDYSATERVDMFRGTAERVYRVEY